jgi:transcription antitermination protein NusB
VAARSKARKRALDVLFEADVREADPLATLAAWIERSDPPVPDYARELVEGVVMHGTRIDEVVSLYAQDWSLDRMPPVDRAVLRLGLYELLWCESIPDGVAIDEAVELAKSLSTEASPGFVNGLLARVLRDGVETGVAST